MLRFLAIVWASPNTILGLVVGLVGVLTGGRLRWNGQTFEATGGGVEALLRSPLFRADAVALGHTLWARSPEALDAVRTHEMRHVRQAEVLGPFFLPCYGLASLIALLRGRHYYRNNWFEIDARNHESSHT